MASWDQQDIWDQEDRLEKKNPLDRQNGSDLADRLETLPVEKDFLLGNDKWVIKKIFDHGPTSAAVKLVYNHGRNTELLICKAVLREETTQQVPKEVRILLDVLPRNERLCRILEYFPAPDNVFLMEFCDGGDLERLSARYRKIDQFFPESFLWHILLQGAEGLAYIHHGHGQTAVPKHKWRPVIHADIKPENIFLQWRPGCNLDTDYPDLKIGDFGLSIIVNERTDEPPYSYPAGTHGWKPPEQPLVTFAADVWSLGAVIHYLCHGREPVEYPASGRNPITASIREVIPIGRYYSRSLVYWFDQVLEKDPVKRIDSAILADSLAGIVPVLLTRREPLNAWAARRTIDQGSTPPRQNWPRDSQDQEPLAEDFFHSDEPSQGYAEYVNEHRSLSFALDDDADQINQPPQELHADDPQYKEDSTWPPPEP
ncbi:hypothetical protein MMC17_005828 [Xylographa soralifera]|nr:hypothetical protein [Xylographa soralifera]